MVFLKGAKAKAISPTLLVAGDLARAWPVTVPVINWERYWRTFVKQRGCTRTDAHLVTTRCLRNAVRQNLSESMSKSPEGRISPF